MWLLLDLSANNGIQEIKVVKEVEKPIVDSFLTYFSFTGAYSVSKTALDIVYRNGASFKSLMTPNVLLGYKYKPDEAVLEANRRVYNYVTSLRTFIDYTEAHLERDLGTEARNKYHDEIQSPIFDRVFGFALFSKLRNYVVHVGFPYGAINVSAESVDLKCSTERLLEWNKWTVLKEKIQEKSPNIKLEQLIDDSNSALYAIWMQFISIFYGKDIEKAIHEYSSFKISHHIMGNVGFAEVEQEDDIKKSFSLRQVPIDMVKKCIDVLRNNPCVTLNIV